MKKLMSILLSAALLLSLAACGSTPDAADLTPAPAPNPSSDPSPAPEQTPPAGTGTPEDGADSKSQGGKVLVVYYSAQNHTEAVAQTIAEHMSADLFELVPTQPYSEEDLNWRAEGSRVNKEHDDQSLRDVELEADVPENWADYDTVFIGYPIWWGIAAWPVNRFILANDFTGKTVIPFCTSSSSGLGESGKLLAEMAGTGDWQEGVRFKSSVDADDVTDWLNGLGLN